MSDSPLFSQRFRMAEAAVAWCDQNGADKTPFNIVTALAALEMLHPQPTLTDEEREAVAGAIDVLEQEDQWHAVGEARIKTLRKMLERLA